MKQELVAFLRCPLCHTALDLHATEHRNAMVWAGLLRCTNAHTWPIRQGIVELLPRAAAYNGAQLVNRLSFAAWGYERLWRPHALSLMSGTSFPLAEECALLVKQLAPKRGGVFLDLACSNGLYSRALAEAASSTSTFVVGLDHSLPMLKEAQQRAQAAGLPIMWIQGLAEELPFVDQSLSGIACGGSFNEFSAPDRVLSEVRRCIQADGRTWWMLARRATSKLGRLLQVGLQPGGIRFPSEQDLVRSLTAAGLHVYWKQHSGAVQMIATRGRIIAAPSG